MKKLLIDVNSIVPYYASGLIGGIGRTTLELVQTLAKIQNLSFEIMLYSQNMKGIGASSMSLPFKYRHLYMPNRGNINKMLSHFPVREMLTNYDIMHIPHNFEYVYNPERCIVTIHDAMFFSYPEDFLGHDFAREKFPILAKKAKAIITCSENSKKEIAYYMDVNEEKIFVSYWGVDRNLFKPLTTSSNIVDAPYFLSVSCDVGRKNTVSVLKAFETFTKHNPDHHLVLVWKYPPDDIINYYTSPKFHNRIHFLKSVSNQQLSELYSSATATFFPSRYEGFGLPILESMACGTPVITCNNSSLPEVGGDAALYVDPDDIDAMSQWMEKFENNSVNIAKLKCRSLEQAAKFTWENCAAKTIKVYEKCLGI